MKNVRLMLDPPATGSWNMAVDQALLETADQTGQLTLRFYSWAEPTISLGYFQPWEDRRQHPPSLDCPLVRRSTGGGAIVHDQEITYSLCVPSMNRWASENERLYFQLHETLIDLLAKRKIEARLCTPTPRNGPQPADPFLCFQRRANGDLLLGDHKICGSAQRRKKHALLQHGSLLFRRSEAAPQLPGIDDLVKNQTLDRDDFLNDWVSAMGEVLGTQLATAGLTGEEFRSAQELQQSCYLNERWNHRR
jgi:lipoate-protein ligase A